MGTRHRDACSTKFARSASSDGAFELVETGKQNFIQGIKDKVVVITGASSESVRERAAEWARRLRSCSLNAAQGSCSARADWIGLGLGKKIKN